jgi:hypothetical protein
MSEQTEGQDGAAPLWNGWAMGMFVGLIALTGMFFGMTRILELNAMRAELYADFRDLCDEQASLEAERSALEAANADLRARFRQLDPRTYPAPQVEARWTCDNPPPAHD